MNIKKLPRQKITPKQFTQYLLLLSLNIIPSSVIAEGEDINKAFHVDEEGRSYTAKEMGVLDVPGEDSTSEENTGVSSKIENTLVSHLYETKNIDIVVYLNLKDENFATTAKAAELEIESINNQYDAEIEELSEQLRAIYRSYQSEESFEQDAEKVYAETLNLSIDKEDQAEAHRLKLEIDASKDRMREEIANKMKFRHQSTLNEMTQHIEKLGGTVKEHIQISNALGVSLAGDLIEKLAEHKLVRSIYADPKVDYELDTSTPAVFKQSSNSNNNTYNPWWTNGDAGCAFDFGVVDTGVKTNHPGYNGDPYESCGSIVFDRKSGSTVTNGHGTHVTGIVVGRNSTYRGVAPSTETVIWANSGSQSTTMANMDWMVSKSGQKPEVINHSLGYGIATSTDYNANDSFYDALIERFDVMVTKSTGNMNWHNSNPTITHPATAYNLMAVANMDDRGTTNRNDDVRRSSSSVGPTSSNRKKPDITAPGTNIMSTHVRWDNSGPTNKCANSGSADYVSCTGTSMAAPHVAGAILLMEDAGVNWPPAQKAVLINTADAWTSNNTSTTNDDGPVTGSHWDKSYGWGYLDMSEARFNRLDYFGSSTFDNVIARNDNNVADDYKLYKGFMSPDEKATLVWEKRAGTYNAGTPSSNRRALTDLNLRLYRESSGVQQDSDTDANDNVHQVAANSTGNSVIKVYSWSSNISGSTSERYALATEENFTRVTPPKLNASVVRPSWVGPNQTFNVAIGFHNSGQVAAHNNVVSMFNAGSVSGDGGTKSIVSIPVGSARRANYTLTTSNASAGNLTIPFNGHSKSYAETYTGSGSLVLKVERTAPTSLCTLATYSNSTSLPVKWQIADNQTGPARGLIYARTPGSGIYSYTGISKNTSGGVENSAYTASTGNGLYRFAIRGRDQGGNMERIPTGEECRTFLDTKKPTATLNTPSVDFGGGVTSTYQVIDPSPSSGLSFVDFWYRKKGTSGWTYTGQFKKTLSGSFTWTPPSDGRYFLFARPKDNAQNLRIFPASNSSGDDSVLYDTIRPTGSIKINSDDAYTGSLIVKLNLNATDANGISRMRFSNNGSTWSDWEAFSTQKNNWDLSSFGGNNSFGIKVTYVQYRDTAGRVSITYRDLIKYSPDSDGDGIVNPFDNCINVPNSNQLDTDGDKFGNACDCDLNNDNIVNVLDLNIFKSGFGSTNPHADFNGDGVVNVLDLNKLRKHFGSAPGPSGLAP